MAWTQAQQTFIDARMRNPQTLPAPVSLPERVVGPDETVYEYLVCTVKASYFPVLVVTDRGVVYTEYKMIRGWRTVEHVPAQAVAGAEYEKRWITGRVHVYQRDGAGFSVKTRLGGENVEWAMHLVDLINRLSTAR